MKIKNLNPSTYKRFFAFGCSFTNYFWPSWADIIGQDIEVYENWGRSGAGNHYIFNSVMEAHARYNFTKDDLVIIMWSLKEREDRYVKDKWQPATLNVQEELYGKDWVRKYGTDKRSLLIRDFAYIKAVHALLSSIDCDWAAFSMQPLFNGENSKIDFYNDPTLGALELAEKWYSVVGRIYAGESVPDIIEHQDVVELYKGIFSDITYIYEKFSYPFMYKRNTPFVEDLHPTPLEALAFLDHVWPKNKLSQTAREYARHWNYEIFKLSKMPVAPIHYVAPITRL